MYKYRVQGHVQYLKDQIPATVIQDIDEIISINEMEAHIAFKKFFDGNKDYAFIGFSKECDCVTGGKYFMSYTNFYKTQYVNVSLMS